jgi:AcrR family transcriptional regulator
MPVRADFQRARNEREKSARRNEILDAADGLLLEAGNERFAISALAARVGVSKSTIFLYFANKEELLLALYARSFLRIVTQLGERLTPGMTGRAFCEAFVDCVMANPSMLLLRSQLASTIERNVTPEVMVATKTEILECGTALTNRVEAELGLQSGYGIRMQMALINLISGAAQADTSPYLDMESLPEDIADFFQVAETRKVFMSGAEFIFCGATGRPFD